MAPKKRKLTGSISKHPRKCKYTHNDRPKFDKVCHGKLVKDGSFCGYRVAVPDVDTIYECRQLPVCRVHCDQVVDFGICEAICECGNRCNARSNKSGPYFQLCDRHKDTQMRCQFFRLPYELRLAIYEELIPKEPIRSGHDCQPLSLTLVCRQMKADVHDLLYNSKDRPAVVEIDPNGIKILGTGYSSVPPSECCPNYGGSRKKHHVVHCSSTPLSKFSHVNVELEWTDWKLIDMKNLFLRDNFQRVCHEILRSGEKANMGDLIHTAAPIMQTIHFHLRWTDTNPYYRATTITTIWNRHFTVLNSLRAIATAVCSKKCTHLSWEVELDMASNDRHDVTATGTQRHTISDLPGEVLVILGRRPTQILEQELLRNWSAFRFIGSFEHAADVKRDQLHDRWRTLQRINIAAIEGRYFRCSKNSRDFEFDPVESGMTLKVVKDDYDKIYLSALYAFACEDDKTLGRLLHLMQTFWAQLHAENKITTINRFLIGGDAAPLTLQEKTALRKYPTRNQANWSGTVPFPKPFPEQSSRAVRTNGYLEWQQRGNRNKFRPIFPSMVDSGQGRIFRSSKLAWSRFLDENEKNESMK